MNEDQVCNAAIIIDVETRTGECIVCGCKDFGIEWLTKSQEYIIYCKQCDRAIYEGPL